MKQNMPTRDKGNGVQKAWRSLSQAERLARLTPRRREIIRPVFEDPRQFVLLSVRDLAKKLGTDPATTVRIARGLGFESYKEFQRYLHELSVVRATSLDTMESGTLPGSNVKTQMKICLDQELKNVRALYSGMDLDRIEAAARRLWKARRILIVGGDAAASLVTYLDYPLRMLGMPVSSVTTPGLTVHEVRLLGKHDVIIGISFRRGLRMTIEALRQAKQQGAYCIGITDTFISPVARFSDEFFLTKVDMKSFGASYTAPTFFLNLLITAIAEIDRNRTLQIMKKVAEEQTHGYRFFQD